jgi:CRISPR-associated endonuclease/helicase Cas3
MNARVLNGYRHELGSVLSADPKVGPLGVHAVAAHHGWGRPHFMPKHYDTRCELATNIEATVAQLERFRMLEAKYGRWTLAYLEAVLKCADIAGSLK